jgi:hypothetical protein
MLYASILHVRLVYVVEIYHLTSHSQNTYRWFCLLANRTLDGVYRGCAATIHSKKKWMFCLLANRKRDGMYHIESVPQLVTAKLHMGDSRLANRTRDGG